MATPLTIDRDARLSTFGIDDRTRALLRECKPFIEAKLDDAIRESYLKMLAYPEAKRAYQGKSLDDLCRNQRSHWLDDILVGTFTETQIRNCLELFAARQKTGLPLRFFISFYTNMLVRITEAVTPHYKRKPNHLLEISEALARTVNFEIELVSAAYMQSSDEESSRILNATAAEFDRTISSVVDSVSASATQLKAAADSMASIASQTAEESNDATAMVSHANENIQTVAAATEQLTSSIQEISSQVSKTVGIIDSAVQEAQRTNQLVQGLADAVGKIGDVVRLINDIASQTNLLALNATIEAARAGDAGKGFAVVANEVKSLANQTSKATEEISAQITAVQTATQDAVAAIETIGQTIGNINQFSTTVASAVEEQRAATGEIARSVDEAARAGTQVTGSMEKVKGLTNKTDTTAQEVSTSMAGLTTQLSEMSQQIQDFVRKIRTT